VLEGLKRRSKYPSGDGVHSSRLKKAENSDGTSERREIDKRDDHVLSRVRKVPAKVVDRVLIFWWWL
jgi:hypothetical protein